MTKKNIIFNISAFVGIMCECIQCSVSV